MYLWNTDDPIHYLQVVGRSFQQLSSYIHHLEPELQSRLSYCCSQNGAAAASSRSEGVRGLAGVTLMNRDVVVRRAPR